MPVSGKWDAVSALANVALVLTAIGALAFAYCQIQEARGQAQAENLQKQEERFFDRAEMREMRKKLACSRLTGDRKALHPMDPAHAPPELYEMIGFFESVGLLTRKKALDAEDVWTNFGYWINNYAVDARPVIENDRKEGAPYWDVEFSRLVDTTEEIARKYGGGGRLDQDDLRDFYQDECESLSSPNPAPRHHKKIRPKAPAGPPTE